MSTQTAIVTGGTRGIGLAAAAALGASGYHVVCTFRSDVPNSQRALEELRRAGASAEAVQLDAGSTDVVRALVEMPCVRDADRLAVLHNAAPPFVPKPLHLVDREEWGAQLAVGLHGFLSLALSCLPRMIQTGGGVIGVVLTRAVLIPPPKGFAAYAAAKQAMRSLARSIAVEYGSRGVRTLCFCPGYMDSAMTTAWSAPLRQASSRAGVTDVSAGGREIARLIGAALRGELPGRGEDYPV